MEFDLYPEKPTLVEEKPKSNIAATVFSVLLFILTFLFIFSDEFNFIFNLVVVLLVHEMGHFVMMKIFRYQHVRMLFVPLMGAFVQGTKEIYSQRQSLIVIGTGPFPGIIIGTVLIYAALFVHSVWMIDLGILFLFLNILNLLPLDPLDGGQLFKLMIYKNQDLFLLIFSFVSSLLLIAAGFLTESWLVMGFGFIMGLRVRSLQKQFYLRKRLAEEDVAYESTYKDLSNRDYHQIKNAILENNSRMQQYLEYLDQEEADQLIAQQVSGTLKSPVIRDAGFIFKLVLILCWIGLVLAPIILVISGANWINEHYAWYFEYLSNK